MPTLTVTLTEEQYSRFAAAYKGDRMMETEPKLEHLQGTLRDAVTNLVYRYEVTMMGAARGSFRFFDPPPPADPAQHAFTEVQVAVQRRLDEFARTRGYDGILSACTYVASAVPGFASEGAYAIQARDAHWAACYEILSQVQTGGRSIPTVDEVLSEMPALAWPA